MRIVAGKWAGRQLMSPGGRVRPTAESLRETIMELVAADLPGARIADLFAGTGALGLEALSRGARYCDFVENGAAALHSLKANVAALRAREKCRIYDRDAIPFVERLPPDRYDIAFADPPYDSRKLDRVVKQWQDVPFARILVLEHSPDHALLPRGKTRRFGESAITVLRARGAQRSADT
ncbi:MAG TPA: RsmD family RNA methyltransferase [Longimicrobiales bacterium]|nr:RsmD family RNA methyltransferase [Longimicrobiales bacterium]